MQIQFKEFGAMRTGLFPAAFVLALSLFISIVFFVALNNFSERFALNEYDRVANHTTSAFSERMALLEAEFKVAAAQIHDNIAINNATAFSDYSFLKAFGSSGSGWSEKIFKATSKSDSDLIGSRYLKYFLDGFDPNIKTRQFKIFVIDANRSDRQILIFASYYSNAKKALVLGQPALSDVYSRSWFSQLPYISRLTLYHANADQPVWTGQFVDDERLGYSKVFAFEQGGQSWRLKASLRDSDDLGFVRTMPLYVLLLGVFCGIFIAICVWALRHKDDEIEKRRADLFEKDKEAEHILSEQNFLRDMLEKAELENKAIIDSVSDIIFETDTDGKIIFLNAAWRKVTGFDPEQFIAQDLFSMLHPQEQKYQREDFRLLVKGQKQAYRSFTRLRTSNGTFRAVEIAVSMMRQDRERNMRVVGTFTDVEERRRAERALGEAEKKYRAIVENAAGGIYQVTPEGIYLSANPAMARILGYDSPEQILREVKNANVSVYSNAKDRSQFLKTTENNNEYQNYETQVYRKDKALIWVNENVRAVRDDSGNVLYYEGSIEDITKRKESEIALREAKMHSDMANRAKSEFLANMSHELRTPLNSIIGFSEMISNEVLGKIEQQSYIEYSTDIHRSGKSLLNIINEILDISKIEAGNRQLNEEVVDLEKVVFSCLDLMSTKIDGNKMQVINTLSNTPRLVGEQVALKQVLMNILSNAIKFTPSNGRITISSDLDHHGELRLSITDTGIGLEPDELQKALSPFGQVDSELNREGTGTGLGLTLVHSLMKLHQGRLDILSQKGIGTTVTLVFPVERVVLNKEVPDTPQNDSDAATSEAALQEGSQSDKG